jgi:hypothetical protein
VGNRNNRNRCFVGELLGKIIMERQRNLFENLSNEEIEHAADMRKLGNNISLGIADKSKAKRAMNPNSVKVFAETKEKRITNTQKVKDLFDSGFIGTPEQASEAAGLASDIGKPRVSNLLKSSYLEKCGNGVSKNGNSADILRKKQ